VPHSRIIILGSINMDVVVTAPRHPQLGETVFGDDLHFLPGARVPIRRFPPNTSVLM